MLREVDVFLLAAARASLANSAGEDHRDLVQQRQRPGRVAGLQGGLLDGLRHDAFADHRSGLTDERSDDPRGEEATTVVDDDRRLLDLQGDIDGFGDGCVRGLLPTTISNSGILSTGEKKCRPMKSSGRLTPSASPVTAGWTCWTQQGIRSEHRLDLGVDLLLERGILEHRLDQQISTLGLLDTVGQG